MALNFPDPATQTPVNTWSPTSTPSATTNGTTYTWDGEKWRVSGSPAFVNISGDTMTGNLTVPSLNDGPLAGFRNQIINPTLSVFQRSANAGGTGYRSADRWRLGGTAPNLQIVFPNIPGLPAGSAGRLTASAGGGTITQAIELPVSGRAAPFLPGTEWTLSFYTTHPSLVAADVSVRFADASNSTANITEFTQGALTSIESLTSGWVRYAVTYTAPNGVAGSNKCVNVRLSGLSDGSAVDFTGIQLEPGPVASPIEIRPYAAELALCQRYYQKTDNLRTLPAVRGTGAVPGFVFAHVALATTMRTTPTVSNVGTWDTTEGNVAMTPDVACPYSVRLRSAANTFNGGSVATAHGGGFAADAEL